jgi:hypothetical protein
MLAEKKKSLEKVSFCGDLYPRTCQKEQETHLTDEPRHLTTRKRNVARRRYEGTPLTSITYIYIYIYVWGKILLRRFVARNGTFEENLGISRSSSKFHATERYL